MHMQTADVDLKHMHRKLVRSIESLKRQEAGEYYGEPDRPSKLFASVLYDVVRAPIRDREHLDALFTAINYLMTENNEPVTQSIERAVDEALSEAIDRADPREQALLALVRYRLKGPRRDLMNA